MPTGAPAGACYSPNSDLRPISGLRFANSTTGRREVITLLVRSTCDDRNILKSFLTSLFFIQNTKLLKNNLKINK